MLEIRVSLSFLFVKSYLCDNNCHEMQTLITDALAYDHRTL